MSPIIIIGGVPGTGKTTLANELSRILNIPAFSKDELEAAIARKGLSSNKEMKGVGYEIMSTLAKRQLKNDSSAIFDFIASGKRTAELWPDLNRIKYKFIECVCSNQETHKKRINSRVRNIEGWYELKWEDVLEIEKIYEPLRHDGLVIDSINDLAENTAKALKYVSSEHI